MDQLPKEFAAVKRLGTPLELYPLHSRFLRRWGNFIIGMLILLGAIGTLLYGLWITVQDYYIYGPAILLRTLSLPTIIALVLFVAGSLALAAAYRNWLKSAVLYEGGMAFADRHGLRAWRWDEIEELHSSVTRHYFSAIYTGTSHRYIVTHRDGHMVTLDDDLQRVDRLAANLRERLVPVLYQRSAEAFNRGQEVTFGPVTVSKAVGLGAGKKAYLWTEIAAVAVKDGYLRVIPAGNKTGPRSLALPVAQIPNLEVLVSLVDQIVGVKIEG